MGTESARRALKPQDIKDGEPRRSPGGPNAAEPAPATDRLPRVLRAAGRVAAAQRRILAVGAGALSEGLAAGGPLDAGQILTRRTLEAQEIASSTALSVAREVVLDAVGGYQALVRELSGAAGARLAGQHSWEMVRAGADLFATSFEALVLCPITAASELLTRMSPAQAAENA